MSELPKHIADSLDSGDTSLGNNPAFPPNDNFVEKLVASYFKKAGEAFDGKPTGELIEELNSLVKECQETERKSRPALEKLCGDILNDMFEIPEDTVRVEIRLTDTVDASNYRILPEEDEDYSFDDIGDMRSLGDEIKKRRMLNALIEGASESVGYDVSSYVKQLFDIDPSLPAMYSKIIAYSRYLMYVLDESKLNDVGNGGTVKVIMKSAPDMLSVYAEATLFPVLLQNAVKGILELSVLQGLPDNKDKAYYVMKKADYKLAEVWDSRLGVPLWDKVKKAIDKTDAKVLLNFFFMELSMLSTETFNNVLQEILAGTKQGDKIVEDICLYINEQMEEEDFHDYITKQNDLYPIEDGYFTESDFPSEEPFGY